jgi:hypothetical protein
LKLTIARSVPHRRHGFSPARLQLNSSVSWQQTPLARIQEDRPLSAEEVALAGWLLEHGAPSASRYLADLAQARVVGRCGCGCASVDFAVSGEEAHAAAGLEVLADFQWSDSEGRAAGVFVFARANRLAGLEVWPLHPAADISRLPRPEQLVPLGGAPAS